MTTIEPTAKECVFIQAYLEAIDFTETGDTDQPAAGTQFYHLFLRDSMIDCLSFFSRVSCYLEDSELARAGHDFWLTRNGHGAGFWDGDWPVYGDLFTKIAKGYGEVDAHYGSDLNQG
jgi:hypothetical protein